MGIEFIETTKRSVTKGWDKAKQRMSVEDLFTIRPELKRTIQFQLCDGAPRNVSGLYILKAENDQIQVYVDNQKVGECKNPPRSLVVEMMGNHDIAIGRFYRESAVGGLIELEVGKRAVKDVEESDEK